MSDNSESFSSYYDFIHPKSQGSGGFLAEVYTNSAPHTLARDVLQGALGDIPRLCPDCGGFCDAHVILVRDAFMRKADELSKNLSKAISVYHAERELGIAEPELVLFKVFEYWNKLSTLYALAEPQDYVEAIQQEEQEEE